MARISLLVATLLVLNGMVLAQAGSSQTTSASVPAPTGTSNTAAKADPKATQCFQGCAAGPMKASSCHSTGGDANATPDASCLCKDTTFLKGAAACVTANCTTYLSAAMQEFQTFCGPDVQTALSALGSSNATATNGTTTAGKTTANGTTTNGTTNPAKGSTPPTTEGPASGALASSVFGTAQIVLAMAACGLGVGLLL
ncbi:hypothetical protein ACQY0O_005856 [Thecaphora frezii]